MTENKLISFAKSAQEKLSIFKRKYNENFHNKMYAPVIYGVFFVVALLVILFLNILFINGGKFTLHQIWMVTSHWHETNIHKLGLAKSDDVDLIKRGIYNVAATVIAGLAMTVAAIATQSLTRNPIAEGSTLGLVQAAIFGVVLALSMGITTLWIKYMYAAIFGIVASMLLLALIYFSKKKESGVQKIILGGLAIGIIFKTLTFIFKAGDQNANSASYAYVLGGAESVSSETITLPTNYITYSLMVTGIMVLVSVVLATINIKGMNLLEIGDERAKNLGSSVMTTRIINILVVLLALPSAVILVGNMAFLGLFAVHFARWSMRTRNYKKVLPISLIVGMLIASLGMQLTEHIPRINSGIWMTFIGAPYLIYVGLRGLK